MRFHFEIKKKSIFLSLQRELIESFTVLNKTDYLNELTRLQSISPEDIVSIKITNEENTP